MASNKGLIILSSPGLRTLAGAYCIVAAALSRSRSRAAQGRGDHADDRERRKSQFPPPAVPASEDREVIVGQNSGQTVELESHIPTRVVARIGITEIVVVAFKVD